MTDIQGGRVIVSFEGRDSNLSALMQKIQQSATATTSSIGQLQQTYTILEANQRKAEQTILSVAQAHARERLAAGDTSGAIRILSQAQAQLTANTDLSFRAQTQLTNVLRRTAEAAQQAAQEQVRLNQAQTTSARAQTTGSLAGLQSQLSLIGRLSAGYFALTRVASTFTDAIAAGNQLEKTQALTEALSGSSARYAEVLALAQNNQQKFGGSLQENLESLSGFVNLSNRTKVSLEDLNNIARRLAIVDPVQGFKGM